MLRNDQSHLLSERQLEMDYFWNQETHAAFYAPGRTQDHLEGNEPVVKHTSLL